MDLRGDPPPRGGPAWLPPLATLLAALAFAATLAALGGIEWRAGTQSSLASRSLARPALLAAACLAALALAWRRHPAVLAARAGGERLRRRLLLVLLLVVAGNALGGPLALPGDSVEYIVQTQAIALDARLGVDPQARAAHWNRNRPGGASLGATRAPGGALREQHQAGGNFGGLYPDRAGTYRYYHFWGYSAFVAPAYLLAHLADPSGRLEYRSFSVVNTLLLCALLALAYALRPGWPALAVLTLSLLSPLVPYCGWAHPEIYCLFFAFAAFWATERGGAARHAGPALLGLAASQNPPLLLFFPLHLLHAVLTERPRGRRALALLALRYAPGCLLGVSSTLYFLWHFGVGSPIAALGLASLDYASAGRLADLVASPLIGALWLMPAFFVLLVPAATRRNAWLVAGALLSFAAAGWLATSTRNLNADQVGPVRYLVWLSAPLLFAALRGAPQPGARGGGAHLAVFGAASLLTVLVSLHFHGGEMMRGETGRFRGARRASPEVAAIYRSVRYRDDVEVLVENVLGRELRSRRDFRGVYVWNLGGDRSLWIVSEAALARLRRFSWAAGALPGLRVEPPGSLAFEHRDGRVTMSAGSAPLAGHAYLGRYARVWMDAGVGEIDSDVALAIR